MNERSNFFVAGAAAMTSDRCEWETPRDLFDRLDAFWHFDLDAASSDGNALCVDHYTRETDGLAHSWAGRRVWCNPPYGRDVARWVEKAYRETRDGKTLVVMLIPARTDTRWFHEWIYHKADDVKFIRGRLKYTLGGVAQNSAPFPSMLVRWGGVD